MASKIIPIRCKGTATMPLTSLQNFQGNLKDLREPEYKKLRKSIEKYGFRFPIFVWGNFILDGHQRIFTIQKMVGEGWSIDSIPVVEIEADSEKEAKALVLLISSRYGHMTDEGLYEFIMTAELNFDELKEEIDLPEINLKQFEQSYFTEEPQDAEPQIDRAEELNKKWQVKTGDLWQIGEHRLLCGDSTKAEDVERVMCGEKAKAIVTDPIYGQGQKGVPHDSPEEMRRIVPAACAILPATDAIAVLFQSPRTFPTALDAMRQNEWMFVRALWIYKQAQCVMPWRGWLLKSEAILVFIKGNGTWNDIHPYSHDCYLLSEVSGELDKDSGWHGSVKPLKVVSDICQRISTDGQAVFDGFLGSGTTMVACQNLNRKCRAIEISPGYCAVTLERMATAFPGIVIKRLE